MDFYKWYGIFISIHKNLNGKNVLVVQVVLQSSDQRLLSRFDGSEFEKRPSIVLVLLYFKLAMRV